MRQFLCYKIRWDTDGMSRKKLKLPKQVIFNESDLLKRGVIGPDSDEDTVFDALTDVLSDDYGFCIFGFHAKTVTANGGRK